MLYLCGGMVSDCAGAYGGGISIDGWCCIKKVFPSRIHTTMCPDSCIFAASRFCIVISAWYLRPRGHISSTFPLYTRSVALPSSWWVRRYPAQREIPASPAEYAKRLQGLLWDTANNTRVRMFPTQLPISSPQWQQKLHMSSISSTGLGSTLDFCLSIIRWGFEVAWLRRVIGMMSLCLLYAEERLLPLQCPGMKTL
jgi:hypothetical protein